MAGRDVNCSPQRVRCAESELTAALAVRLLSLTLRERDFIRSLQLLGNR
jgi:hypothetical protein